MNGAAEISQLYTAVVGFRQEEAAAAAFRALAADLPAGEILSRGLAPAMEEVGRLYDQGRYFVPELLLASDAFAAAQTVLEPHLSQDEEPAGRLVLGTIEGDVHEIGKNLVGLMFRSAGWQVVDLGGNVSAARFAQACREFQPHLVGLSSLMTTGFRALPEIVRQVRWARPEASVMVGGASLDQELAARVGADAYAPNAAAAVAVAQRLLP